MTYPNEPDPYQQPYGPPQGQPYGPPQQPLPSAAQPMSTINKIGIGVGVIIGGLILIGVIGALFGVGAEDDGKTPAAATSSSAPAASEDAKESSTPSAKPKPKASSKPPAKPSPKPAAETAALPDLVGKGLQDAQDTAQAAGFYLLDSHDLTGQGRLQVWDRNWKVCDQTPSSGKRPTDTTVDFGVVKLEEACP